MPETRLRPGVLIPKGHPGMQEGVPGSFAQRHHGPDSRKELDLPFQERSAAGELASRGTVARRSAPHRSGHVAAVEAQAVVPPRRGRLTREPRTVEGAVKPVPARISREHASGAVPSMGCRGKADDEESGAPVSEARDRPAPIRPVPESGDLPPRHRLAIAHEPRTPAALRDIGSEFLKGPEARDLHSSATGPGVITLAVGGPVKGEGVPHAAFRRPAGLGCGIRP
jgi:hypothetical protein